MKGATLRQGLAGGPRSFYGPARIPGLVERRMDAIRNNPKWRGRLDAYTDAALAGSNLIVGYTDQGSANDPNYAAGGTGVNINRERFNVWGGAPGGHQAARRAQEEQQRRIKEGRERDKVDSALRTMSSNLGGAHITVDFTGVPKDVKTNAELLDEGVFKSLKLNRSTAQAGMAGQNTAPQNNWQAGE